MISIDLSDDKSLLLDQLVAEGRFSDRRAALDHAVDLLREETETLDDIREGLSSILRGEGTLLDEAVHGLRGNFNIPHTP